MRRVLLVALLAIACTKPDNISTANAGIVGPRSDPELASEGVKLLPADFRQGKSGPYKPALLQFWTWRVEPTTELLVATAVHDPSTLGQPKGDLNDDYGAILVLRRTGGKLELLVARKTGEAPPKISAGPNNTVTYSFYQPCGVLGGSLSYRDGKVVVNEKACSDL
jgi:hypothetical protein